MQLLQAIALAATFATTVLAQSVGQLPTCAQSCVGGSFGGCSSLNVQCICSNKDYISSLSCCIAKSCSPADQDATIKFAVQVCQLAGVSVPTSASCATGASATDAGSATTGASGSAAPTAVTATTVTSASAQASKTAAATTAATSSAAAKASNAAVQNSGNTFGMGVAVAGLLAML